jgi:demethylmenaquinone methyltransferase/2-methoxy-6-polyprenyl-1,4-benzoquinol methylase
MQAQMERRMLLLFAQTALEKLRQRSAVNAVNYADYQRRFFGRPDVAGSRHDTFAAMRSRVVALAQPEPDAPILDACAGAGWQARAFARAGHRRVVAIDLVVERLVGARRVEPGEPIAFCAMDAARLAFGDGSFGCASLTLGLHDMPYDVRRRVLRELARVTRGRVVIAEPSAPRHPLLRWAYCLLGELIDESYFFGDWSRSDLGELVGAAGLRVVHQERALHGIVALHVLERP